MLRKSLFTLLFLFAAMPAWAQHQHPTPNLIKGSEHPELIPDLTAQRLWLVAISAPPSAGTYELQRQDAFTAKAGLNALDRKRIEPLLVEFKAQYAGLIAAYNKQAEAGAGNQALFLEQRDDLVRSTIARLNLVLSSSGAALLQAHIAAEKHTMQMAVTGVN